jgi:hypothetical protein
MKRTYWIAWGSQGLCGYWTHSHNPKAAVRAFKQAYPNDEPAWVGQWMFHRKVERRYDPLSEKVVSERSLARKDWDPEGSHRNDWFKYPGAGWGLNDAHRHPNMTLMSSYSEDDD